MLTMPILYHHIPRRTTYKNNEVRPYYPQRTKVLKTGQPRKGVNMENTKSRANGRQSSAESERKAQAGSKQAKASKNASDAKGCKNCK